MPLRLPIFPLSVALFPGNLLPLHIFEPRYRRMLADCLAGDRRFGLSPSPDNSGVPGPGAIGCVAEIRVNQELPDGRSNIVVLGGPRFALVRTLDEALPYQVALVELFEDEDGTFPDVEEVESLRRLSVQYFNGVRELSDAPPEELTLPDDALSLSFHVAGGVECALSVKQRLLAERSTARRVHALNLLLPVLISGVENGIRIHRRAHTNGKGGMIPDVLTGQ